MNQPDKGAIISFKGSNRFLSNFYVCPVKYDGNTYPSSEHAFQAAKCMVRDEHDEIMAAKTPSEAKKLGHECCLRDDWERVKAKVMWKIVKAKFEQNYDLQQLLLQTGERVLVEGNRWHDDQFGVCYCDKCHGHGQNLLGRTLTHVREQIRNKGGMKWKPDKEFAGAHKYDTCLALFDPERGRIAMTWRLDNDRWRWDTDLNRGTAKTQKKAMAFAEFFISQE